MIVHFFQTAFLGKFVIALLELTLVLFDSVGIRASEQSGFVVLNFWLNSVCSRFNNEMGNGNRGSASENLSSSYPEDAMGLSGIQVPFGLGAKNAGDHPGGGQEKRRAANKVFMA